jgi:hypothetical protein
MAVAAVKPDPPFVGGNWSSLRNRTVEERFWLGNPKPRNITIEVWNNSDEEIMLVATSAQDEQNLRPQHRPYFKTFETGAIPPGKHEKISIKKTQNISAAGLHICSPNGQQLAHLAQDQNIYVLIRVS